MYHIMTVVGLEEHNLEQQKGIDVKIGDLKGYFGAIPMHDGNDAARAKELRLAYVNKYCCR